MIATGMTTPLVSNVNRVSKPPTTTMPQTMLPDMNSTQQLLAETNQMASSLEQTAKHQELQNRQAELQQQYLTALQAPRSASPPPLTSPTGNMEVDMANATINELHAEGNRWLGMMPSAPPTMPTLPTSPTGVSPPPSSSTLPALNSTTLSGDKGSQLAQAATALKGASSKDGPGGGNVACAWKTAKALRQLGYDIKPGSPEEINVNAQIAFLKKKGAQEVAQSEARPGDVVWVPGRHIGIVESGQGTTAQVISNSSSKASFSWQSDINFDKHYGQNTKILRLA